MGKDVSAKNGVSLGTLLTAQRILILKGKQSKSAVFEKMIQSFGSGEDDDADFLDDVQWGISHREDLMTTAMGNGIAIPHTLLSDLDEPLLALALCPDGIGDYQTPDGVPVRMVWMLLSVEDQAMQHLQVISSIGSLFYDGRLKTAFLAANSPEGCLEILARAEA